MDIVIKKFVELVHKRDTLLKNRLNGEKMEDACKKSEFRSWYQENVFSLDSKIISIGNRIAYEYNLNYSTAKTIQDIYSNQTLNQFVANAYSQEQINEK